MCEMMGSDPIEEEMPFERQDLDLSTQAVLEIYDKLPSKWEGMSGSYLGKDLLLLPVLCDEFNIDKHIRRHAWNIIPIIDSYVAEDIAEKMKRKTKGKV